MGYQVKWVEDSLGVSRKALRNRMKEVDIVITLMKILTEYGR